MAHTPSHFPTPFVGRATELVEILRLISQDDCRLLTLIGPGGIGKTRLAAQAMAERQRVGCEVCFVDLQPVQSSDFLLTAIVDALDLPRSSLDLQSQLHHALQNRELLLVLDNFEHLVDEVDLLSDLLRAAPRLKLLVTSRVVLHLQEEWLYPIEGLRYFEGAPSSIEANELAVYEATQLFLSCACRLRPDFRLEVEKDGVARLCSLAGGIPLAIELAAAWVKTLSADAIAREIEQDLDFLSTSLRNVPEKHRSMQVIFQRSWQLLDAEERAAFAQLAVFRGGFDRAAALQVAGTTITALSSLVDKSLLRPRPGGRYEIHELLRQYAAEQLAQSPSAMARTCARHSQYYTGFLADQVTALTTQQHDALMRTQAELDNIRAAWQWAVEQGEVAYLQRAAMPFFAFCQGQSRYQEGVAALTAAYDALSKMPDSNEKSHTLADLLTGRGWLELRLGQVEEAGWALEQARQIYAAAQIVPAPVMGADPLAALPLVALIRGEYETALTLAEGAWRAASDRNDPANLALSGYSLTSTAIAQGRYEEAFASARKTLSLTKMVGNRWFMAYIYNHLGEITEMMGDLAAARSYYEASHTLRVEFDDPEGIAVALNHLGEIALQEGDYEGSQEFYRQSVHLYEGIGDRGGLIRALRGLGLAAHRLGQTERAQQQLRRALQLAVESQIMPFVLLALISIGAVLLDSGASEWGMAALTFVDNHPASDQIMRARVRQILASHRVQDAPTQPVTVGSLMLADLISALETELSLPQALSSQSASLLAHPLPRRQQKLIEPLSEREQEVLTLVARGLKNSEIADELVVTLSTVKAHINNIYRKLDVTNRVQAISRGQELGFL